MAILKQKLSKIYHCQSSLRGNKEAVVLLGGYQRHIGEETVLPGSYLQQSSENIAIRNMLAFNAEKHAGFQEHLLSDSW